MYYTTTNIFVLFTWTVYPLMMCNRPYSPAGPRFWPISKISWFDENPRRVPWPESSWSVFGNSIEFLYFHEIPSAWGSSPAAILSILFMYYGSMYHNLAFLSVLSVLSGQYGASCNFEPPAGRWGPRTPHAEMPQLLWWGWQCKCGWTIINPAFSVLQLINSQFCWC